MCRKGATVGAFKRQQAGLTRYSCGRITVLDRPRLEKRARDSGCVALSTRIPPHLDHRVDAVIG